MNITWNKKTLHVLHVILHNQPILHDFYMLFQIYYMQITCILHDITWILHEYFFIFPFLSNVTPSFCFLAGTQSACWMFTRKFALNPLHGWLLPFILYWDKNPCGMNEGGIPIQWGTLSSWWNAMIACLRGGMTRHAKHTLKDGQTNEKWRLILLA